MFATVRKEHIDKSYSGQEHSGQEQLILDYYG